MSVTPGFQRFVVDQLAHGAAITSRAMFGGVGLYADGVFFALIDDDRLYFKVDDATRGEFERAGTGPFRPYGDDRAMAYYEVPVDVLEDADALASWRDKAVDVARRAKQR